MYSVWQTLAKDRLLRHPQLKRSYVSRYQTALHRRQRNSMPKKTVILQVFVASPSDVSDERGILEAVITQLNQIWSNTLGITFELIKWETHVRPSFSTDPQSAINEQIGLGYDVFIGIFWSRVGTPTPRAASGTIEEFERAYARFSQNKDWPEIMLYFKDAPISPSKIDIQQFQDLQQFKGTLSNRGALYSEFEDLSGFESSLRAHLSAIAQKISAQSPKPTVEFTTQAPEHSHFAIADEDDYGYIDYLEIFESRQAEITEALKVISDATVRVGEQLAQ